jgi:hypothetical protein
MIEVSTSMDILSWKIKRIKISEGIGTVKVFFGVQIFRENRVCNGLEDYDMSKHFNNSSGRRVHGGKTRGKTDQVVVFRQ